MRLAKILVSILLTLRVLDALADVEHYFSTIKHDPAALYEFFKDMPKGGELHYHLTGGASPELMLSLAPLGNYCMNATTYAIQSTGTGCHEISLNSLKKDSKLYNKILRAWSMKDFIPKTESGHDHFFAIFYKFTPIAASFGPELMANVMKRAARQHELYLEVMVLLDNAHSSSFGQFIKKAQHLTDKQKLLLANPQFRENIRHTSTESTLLLKKTRQLLGCDSLSKSPACALTIKLQYIILREQPLDNFFAQALNGFAAASQSRDLVGINLVQAEDGPISLRDYHKQMIILSFLHHAYPNVHIALHAGELTPGKLDSHTIKDNELRYHIHDALLTGHAERIGHGVDIQYEDDSDGVLNMMSKAAIPVEVSLTSNRKILNLSGKQHPFRNYLAHHVPVVLSTDDEGILRTNLTHEYVNAVIEQELDYPTIKTINRNALTYSFLPGKSIWQNPSKGQRVPECYNLYNESCQQYVALSEKAKLQWDLENQLTTFESRYSDSSFLEPVAMPINNVKKTSF